jgi:hypothetical protein
MPGLHGMPPLAVQLLGGSIWPFETANVIDRLENREDHSSMRSHLPGRGPQP